MSEVKSGAKKKLLAEVKGRCCYCGCKLFKENTTWDHIIPKSKGGTVQFKNMVACCFGCNYMKRVYSVEELRTIMERSLEISHYVFYFEKIKLMKVQNAKTLYRHREI